MQEVDHSVCCNRGVPELYWSHHLNRHYYYWVHRTARASCKCAALSSTLCLPISPPCPHVCASLPCLHCAQIYHILQSAVLAYDLVVPGLLAAPLLQWGCPRCLLRP